MDLLELSTIKNGLAMGETSFTKAKELTGFKVTSQKQLVEMLNDEITKLAKPAKRVKKAKKTEGLTRHKAALLISEDWKKERSLSGVIRFILKGWNNTNDKSEHYYRIAFSNLIPVEYNGNATREQMQEILTYDHILGLIGNYRFQSQKIDGKLVPTDQPRKMFSPFKLSQILGKIG
jgi:hypothetical protein